MRRSLFAVAFVFAMACAPAASATTPTPTPIPVGVPGTPAGLHVEGPVPHLVWTRTSTDEDGFRLYLHVLDKVPIILAIYPAGTQSSPITSSGDVQTDCAGAELWVTAFNDVGESRISNKYVVQTPPSGCRYSYRHQYTNDTDVIADKLQFGFSHGVESVELVTNAPGCADPVVDYAVIRWPSPCVDPGESVELQAEIVSPGDLREAVWSAEASPTPTVGPTASVTPTPILTPAALPEAGGPPGERAAIYPLLVSLAVLLAGTMALKRIR